MTPSPAHATHDVVVVGAGPAGCSAAVTLTRAGRHVALVDKASFPRDKTCGDGLTVWALRELEALGFEPATVPSWHPVDAAWVGSPSRAPVELPLPRGQGLFAAVARRAELDAALLDLAAQEGVAVLEGWPCTGAAADADGITVVGPDGVALRAAAVIGADGVWSPLRRHLGGPDRERPLGEWHAFRQYASRVGPLAASRLYAWFEPDFLPGYAWSFPVGQGEANVGFGILRGGRWPVGAMGRLWAEILERPHIREVIGPDAVLEGRPQAWPIPARADGVTLHLGRALFVGDAAAAADPLTGEGIGQALATGRWAAEAIIAGHRDPADAARRYERSVHDHLHADHAMSNLLGRAIGHRKGARVAIRLASMTPWTRRNFARWLFEDYPRSVISTPRRWHRGVFTGPGAYRSS
jgi:geranylgeranyl reductase family protein